jgi:putative protease
MTGTELLAPGGSLDQAVHALRAGADAVYCGAPRFSARSHAKNLDFPQLRRLCGEAGARDCAGVAMDKPGTTGMPGVAAGRPPAKVYLAINTVIRQDELDAALETAWRAWEAGAAALIVQDLGLARALRRHGPPLPRHASTQLAVHSAAGAAAARDLGFTRTVLARELSIGEIAAVVRAVPELEYECFIHGALCYGVSGLCLASGLLLGRSGNRGDCGQVCRTWSRLADGAKAGQAGCWFSMNDLEASGLVRDLVAAGVRSFKIEGRMKPPEWTAAVVRHYRGLLDDPRAAPDQASLDAARTVFGRQASAAYLRDPRGVSLVNHAHAGSVGLPAGTVRAAAQDRLLVTVSVPLAVKDGIQLLRPGAPGQPPEVLRLGVKSLELAPPDGKPAAKAGRAAAARPLFACHPGQSVWIATGEGRFGPADVGLELAKVADHASNLPAVKPESLPLFRHGLAVRASLDAAAGRLRLSTVLVPGAPTLELALPLATAASDSADGFRQALAAQLGKSGEAAFGLGCLEADASLQGRFAPPAALKEIRRAWLAALVAGFEALVAGRLADLAAESTAPAPTEAPAGTPGQPVPPPRSALSPAGGLPFSTGFAGSGPEPGEPSLWRGPDGAVWRVLPLPPVCFDEERFLEGLVAWIAGLPAGDSVLLGLNNLAHLDWMARLRCHPVLAGGRRLAAFADYGLYAANRSAVAALRDAAPELLWFTPWVEEARLGGRADSPAPGGADQAGAAPPLPAWSYGAGLPAAKADPDFKPPLFISRACFRRSSLGLGCPPSGPEACPRRFGYRLEQGSREFRVMVRDCLSYTFAD